MTKKLIFGIVLLCMLASVTAVSDESFSLIYNQPFNNETTSAAPAGWTINGGACLVGATPSATNKSMNCTTAGSTNWHTLDFRNEAQWEDIGDTTGYRIEFALAFQTFPDSSLAWNFPRGATKRIALGYDSGNLRYRDAGATWQDFSPAIVLSTDTYYDIVLDVNTTGYWIGVDDVDVLNASTVNAPDEAQTVAFRHYSNNGQASINYFRVYNMSLSLTPPVITEVYPLSNRVYNDYDGWINFTTDQQSNCSINDSSWVKNTTLSDPTNLFFYNPSTLSEGNYSINISCWDAEDNNDSIVLPWKIDTTNPLLTGSSLSSNLTIWLNNLTFQFNYSDERKLFKINVSTPEGYGLEITNINTTTYSYNGSVDISGYSTGVHNITTSFCDAHTAQRIGDYTYILNTAQDKITYRFGSNEYITIEAKDKTQFMNVNTWKEYDRYKFDFIKTREEDLGLDNTYIVHSTKKIEIVGSDEHEGWMIISDLNKWIDFDNSLGYKASLKRIDDYTVEVTTKATLFNSIGDLNCDSKIYKYYVYNFKTNYNTDVLELETETISLTINATDTPMNKTKVNGTLIYNNTVYGTTKSIVGSLVTLSASVNTPLVNNVASINFNFNYTIDDTTFQNSTVLTQTVRQIYVGSCGGITNVTTLNVTFNKEEELTRLDSNLNVLFELWKDNPDNKRNLSYGYTGVNNLSFCIYPTNETFRTYTLFQFDSTGYPRRNYYLVNETLSNTTRLLDLYLLNEGNATAVTLDLTDKLDDDLIGYYAYLERKYVENNTYRTVQIERTDLEGNSLYQAVLDKVFYRWIFKDPNGEILESTEDNLITRTSLIYRVTLDTPFFTNYDDILEVSSSLTIDNSTGVVTFTYSDLSSLDGEYCLKIEKFNTITTEIESTQCSTLKTNTITYTLQDTVSGNYRAKAYVLTEGSLEFPTLLLEETIKYGNNYRIFGKLGLFTNVLWTMALVSVGGTVAGLSGIIVGGIIGLSTGVILQMISIPWTILLSVIILAGIIIWKIRQ